MAIRFLDMVKALAELDSLLGGNGAVDGGLYFLDGRLAALMHKWGNVKGFSRMVDDVARNGKRGLSEYIAEHIVELQVGNRQAVLGSVLLSGLHICQLAEIADKIPQMPDDRRRNETGFNHIAHEEIANPFCVL